MADGLLNKASIILTPTGYKAGTLYNVAPVVEPYEDFDFARASVASRVNSSGLVEMVGRTLSSELMPSVATIVNLLGGSITQISSNSYSSTSDGTTGSSLRPKFDFNTTSGKTYKLVITPTGAITGTLNFDFYDGSSYLFQNYDFTTTKEIYFTDNGSVFGGFDGTKTYSIASFTISIKEIIDTNNIPRISYDSNGDNGHILLEPTSTNLLPYSEDLLSWINSGGNTLTSGLTSPNGDTSAFSILSGSGASSRLVYITTLTAVNTQHTISTFVKQVNNYPTAYLRWGHSELANNIVTFNFDTETLTDVSGNNTDLFVESYNNGWYRIGFTFTTGSSITNQQIQINRGANVEAAYWGLQIEALSFPTSYIPTLTGSTVTRATETATGAGSADLINSTEGVLYAEIEALENGGIDRIISLSDETNNNLIYIRIDNTANRINSFARGGGGSYNILTVNGVTQTNNNKIALAWDATNIRVWINGSESSSATINNLPLNMSTLSFTSPVGGSPFYG